MLETQVAGRGVQSIEIGGRVLAALAGAAAPLMLRDLAALADLPSAQAHAYLVSLRKIGLVEQTEGRYRLGPFALHLGLARMRAVDALRLATQAAPGLAADMGLMIAVTVWGSLGATVVQVNEAVDQIHVNLRPGTVFSALHTATGRLFAAYLPATILESHLTASVALRGLLEPKHGETTDALRREVEATRHRGYGRAQGSPIPGVNAVAAPVFDHTGDLKLALTAIGPAARVDIEPGSAPVARLTTFARELSLELGFSETPPP